MKLGQKFANFANKVKNFGLQAGSTLAKVAPKAIKVGSFIAGALSNLPGTIGTAAGYVHKGLDTVNNIISALPSSQFKDKLQSISDKAGQFVNRVEPGLRRGGETARVYGDTAGTLIDAIRPAVNKFSNKFGGGGPPQPQTPII